QQQCADAGAVAETRTAVDQRVVVVLGHVLAQIGQEAGAAQPVVEAGPVERTYGAGVGRSLPAGGKQIELAAVGEAPVQRHRVPTYVRLDRCGLKIRHGGGELADQVDDAIGGVQLRGG